MKSETKLHVGRRRNRVLASVCAAMLGVAAAFADDIPFWGDGSPDTNRVAAVGRHHVITSFSSYVFDARRHVFDKFDSTKWALTIIIR